MGGRIDFSCVLNLIFGSLFDEKLMGTEVGKIFVFVFMVGVLLQSF